MRTLQPHQTFGVCWPRRQEADSANKLLRDYVEQENLGVKAISRAELHERVRAVRYRAAQMNASAPRLPPPKAYRREARRIRPVH